MYGDGSMLTRLGESLAFTQHELKAALFMAFEGYRAWPTETACPVALVSFDTLLPVLKLELSMHG
jgi:hypothetical protein